MRIKKVMWICTMGQDNLTNQLTDLIAQHLKCFGPSEMPEQGVIKIGSFWIVNLDCVSEVSRGCSPVVCVGPNAPV